MTDKHTKNQNSCLIFWTRFYISKIGKYRPKPYSQFFEMDFCTSHFLLITSLVSIERYALNEVRTNLAFQAYQFTYDKYQNFLCHIGGCISLQMLHDRFWCSWYLHDYCRSVNSNLNDLFSFCFWLHQRLVDLSKLTLYMYKRRNKYGGIDRIRVEPAFMIKIFSNIYSMWCSTWQKRRICLTFRRIFFSLTSL